MSYYKVVYDKLFPYAPYLNERIGIEILVEVGQSPTEALQEAKRIVEDFYHASNPQPISGVSIVADNVPVPEVQVAKEAPISDLQAIENCTTLEELGTFTTFVKGKADLEAAYFIKKTKLTKK